ncbi:hypothetical protein ACFWPU_19275 [Streptomyces sp. NPDC058471]|uniref:DinB/UmuC family translesion DNA polymerase n=1 Tax=Streptomyces sp. NPDC058471 TaxID=3346516 RepID=UPI0036504394
MASTPRSILAGRMPESTSAQHVFERDVIDPDLMRAVVARLTATLGTRLCAREQAARSVALVLRFASGSDLSKSRRLPEASAHTEDLRDMGYRILRQHGLQRGRVRRITVVAEDLVASAPTPVSSCCAPSWNGTAAAVRVRQVSVSTGETNPAGPTNWWAPGAQPCEGGSA